MAVEIGALRAMLSLNSAAFEKGAKRAQASMNTLQRRLTASADRIQSVGRKMSTRMTLPIVAMGGAALRSSLQTVDAQSKMAQSLQTSTRSMQVLARAADRAGISTGELEQVGRQLTKRLSQAATGTGPAVKALDKLGLKAEDLAGMDLDQKIAVINRAIADQVPKAEQAAVAMALFGDRAGILAGRLDADTIAAANAELERFGVTVTEIEADKIEEANDAISALGLVARGLGNQLAVALAPTLQSIAEWLADMGAKFSALSPRMQKLTIAGVGLAAAIGPLAIALGFVATGLAALMTPIGGVVLALGAAAGVSALVAAHWDDLKERFPILEKVEEIGKNLKEAWDDLPSIKWALLVPALRWAKFIPGLRWAAFIPKLSWAALTVIPKIGWVTLAGGLKWGALIGKLSWAALRVIPGIGWAALAGSLAWNLLVDKIEWNGWIPTIKWAEWITKINWSDWIPKFDWGSALDPSRKTAKQMGYNLGYDLGDGLGVGFGQTQSALEAQTREYLNSLEQAARDESQTQSPSRKWMELGRDLMDGLGIGIGDNARKAGEAAARAASQVGASAGAALSESVAKVPDMFENVKSFAQSLKGTFRGLVTGALSFKDALSQVLGKLADRLWDRGFDMLFSGGGSGGGGGGIFGGIASFLGNLFSFDGGGFTGMGARVGGVDGKGGFPAILHPNETVIDHTRGGGFAAMAPQQVHVTVGMDVDASGNMMPFVTSVSGQVSREVSGRQIEQYDREIASRGKGRVG